MSMLSLNSDRSSVSNPKGSVLIQSTLNVSLINRDFASTLKDKIRIKMIFLSEELDQASKGEILKREMKNACTEER